MQKNKEKIRNSAIQLFSAKGIHQATLQDIAKDTGISRGTLFYYYPSKNELMYDVLDYCINELILMVKNTVNNGGEKTGPRLIEMVLKNMLENDIIVKITFYLFQESMLGNEKIKSKLKHKYEVWRDEIKELLQPLRLAEAELDARVAVLLGAIDGICLQYLLSPHTFNLKETSMQLSLMIGQMSGNTPPAAEF